MTSGALPYPPRDAAARRRAHRRYGRKAWREARLEVLARDHWKCHYCGADATIADHVIRPEDGGAEYDPANLVAACHSCNIRRHHGNLGYRTGSPSPAAEPRNPLLSPLATAKPGRAASWPELTGFSLRSDRSAVGYDFACHRHRYGPGPAQIKIIGWMTPGAPILDHCPPDCTLPKAIRRCRTRDSDRRRCQQTRSNVRRPRAGARQPRTLGR